MAGTRAGVVRRLRRGGWLLVAIALACARVTVSAHGGPPSALGVVVAEAGQPRVVLVNEGLAVLSSGEWTYLCPRSWGDPSTTAGKLPLAVADLGPDSLIVGADDLYVLRAGVASGQGRAELSRSYVVAVTADRDGIFGLRLVPDGSELLRIAPGQATVPLWKSARVWSTLAVDASGLHLGMLAGANLIALAHLDRHGNELGQQQAQLDLRPVELWLRPVAGRLFVVATDGALYVLAGSTQGGVRTLRREVNAIAGPLASRDGSLWIAVGGQLMHAAVGDAFEPVAEARQVTCLERWNDLEYACVGSELYRLTNLGLGERLFELRGLRAPAPGISASGGSECAAQWLLFSNDLELAGLAPREWGAGSAGMSAVAAPALGASGASAAAGGPALPAFGAGAGAPAPGRASNGCSAYGPHSSSPLDCLLIVFWAAIARWRCSVSASRGRVAVPARGRQLST